MATAAYPGLAIPGSTWPNYLYTGPRYFTTPHVERPMSDGRISERPFHKVKYKVGLSVLKDEFGAYRTVESPTNEEVAAAAVAYIAGRTYEIEAEEAADLIAAGYEVIEP